LVLGVPATQAAAKADADLLQRAGKPDGAVMSPVARDHEALFPASESDDLRRRWNDIQASFVDEPKPSVEKADQLVASVIQKLAQVFAEERSKLESNWSKGGEVSTEDLRQALRRYRSFFDRLLSV
jgi:hypothetical protein